MYRTEEGALGEAGAVELIDTDAAAARRAAGACAARAAAAAGAAGAAMGGATRDVPQDSEAVLQTGAAPMFGLGRAFGGGGEVL